MFAILTKYIGINTSFHRYILWGKLGKYKVTDHKDIDCKWLLKNGIAIDKHLKERVEALPNAMYIDGKEWFLSEVKIIKMEEKNGEFLKFPLRLMDNRIRILTDK